MLDLAKIKRRDHNTEFIGGRIDSATKRWLEQYCKNNGVTVSAVLCELVRALKRTVQNTNNNDKI